MVDCLACPDLRLGAELEQIYGRLPNWSRFLVGCLTGPGLWFGSLTGPDGRLWWVAGMVKLRGGLPSWFRFVMG